MSRFRLRDSALYWTGLLALMSLVLAYPAKGQDVDERTRRALPVEPASRKIPESYRLNSNDVLRITVFQEDELSTVTRIGKDGAIQFPMIGRSVIGGKTLQGAAELIEEQLREYLVRPQVAITVLDYSKRRFTIMGQVNRPGSFEMPDEASVNLIEAIGMAGGYSRIANPSKVILKREEDGTEKTYRLDAKRMARDEDMERFQVRPGDTIIVGESIF